MVKKQEPTKAKTYQIEFHTPDFMRSSIATNFVIQSYDDNFKVSLYELKPDIALTDEDRNKIEKRGTLRTDCVGSFIINPRNLKAFIDIMNEHLSKYEKSKEESKT